MASLTLDHLSKTYGESAIIHDVSFSIEHGEFIVIVGPSGCGKSTLLRMIAGLESVTAGQIRIDGTDVTPVPAARRGIAMVFQSYALYPHMTIRENLSFGLKNLKYPRAEIERRVQEAATLLQLDSLLERLPNQLSGGQRQRVAIGRAIVREPKIFLFDEPLSNLDAELRVQMRRELAKLHRRLGSTMIYVTHDQVEAMTLADKILLLNKGRIAQFGSPLELYNAPRDIFTASFIGSPGINLIEARILALDEGQATVGLKGDTQFKMKQSRIGACGIGATITVGMRPEHLRMTPAQECVGLAVRASVIEALGDATCIYATLADKSELALKLQGQDTGICEGAQFTAYIDQGDLLLFDSDGRLIRAEEFNDKSKAA
jgi:ABC-type sugar transport system ATPase subunit